MRIIRQIVRQHNRWQRFVGALTLFGAVALFLFVGYLFVAPAPIAFHHVTLDGQNIRLFAPRSWVNFAGNCIDIRWEVDKPSPDLANDLQTITHYACIGDDYVPSFEFFGYEDWLYHDAVRIGIVSQSVEIAILLIAAALLLIPAIRTGILPRIDFKSRSTRRFGALACILLALVMLNTIYTAAKPSLFVTPVPGGLPFFVSFQPTRNVLPDGCLDLRWEADGAREVFLNDAPVTERGEQQYCASGTQLSLSIQINTPDNRSYVYALTAPIFDTEEIRLTIATGLLLLFLAGALLDLRWNEPPWKISRASAFAVGLSISLVAILHRPVNGLRFSASTLPLPLGTIALLLVLGGALYGLLRILGLSRAPHEIQDSLARIAGSLVYGIRAWLLTLGQGVVRARQALGIIILVGTLAVALFIVLNVSAAAPQTIDTQEGEARIFFSLERYWPLLPSQCATVRWKVDFIQAVYLNGKGTGGEGAKMSCAHPFGYQTLKVDLRDGTFREYRLFFERWWLSLEPIQLIVSFICLALLGWALIGVFPFNRERGTKWIRPLLLALVFIGLWCIGFSLRLHYLGQLGPRSLWGAYAEAAYGLIASGIYSNRVYPPGYPLFQAMTIRAHMDATTMVALQCLIDATTVLPVYLLFKGCKLPTWVALAAALTYAVYPMFSQASSVAMGETFSCMMVIWLLLLLVQAANTANVLYWFAGGGLLGLMVLFRPDTIFFGGLAGLWLLVHRLPQFPVRKVIVSGLALAVGWLIFVGGWGLYNLANNGRMSFTSGSGGLTIYAGLGQLPNPHLYAYSAGSEWVYDRSMQAHGYDVSRWGDGQYWSDNANQDFNNAYWQAWRENPGYIVEVILYRWRSILSFYDPFFVLQNGPAYNAKLQAAVIWPEFFLPLMNLISRYGLPILLLAVILYRRQPAALAILLLPILSSLVSIGVVYYEPRYVQYGMLSYVFAALLVFAAGIRWLNQLLARSLHTSEVPSLRSGEGVGGEVLRENERRVISMAGSMS